ncbi:MAG TPA: hypothetical protein VK752_08555 [Bryobacteraceae bacterium]|jgi:hypothetical protein|nr:hypothetical protein [Bryobacteraceae bacterium]
MRAKAIVFALSACAAFGQDTARVFHLHHIDQTQDLNEFTTLVRTISDIPQVSADAAQKTLSVRGTASQVAIAEFLFTELDRQTVPDSVTQEFRVSNNADDVVRIFFAPYTATVQQFQEIATTVRTIAEIRRVFTYNTPRALAVRGTADQVAATEWMIRELDQPADAKRTDSRPYQMIDPRNMGFTAVRVFYVPYASTVQQFQEVATLVRTIGEIRQVFTYNTPRALIVRGTPDQVALADWMIHELGKPVTTEASQKYTYPDVYHDGENVVRVFYVRDVATVPAFQQLATQIRTATKIRRVFTYNESKALALRGTEAQLATAEQMLQDRQLASK